jgi:prophage regulatory protein
MIVNNQRPGRPRLTEAEKVYRLEHPKRHNRKADHVSRPDIVALASLPLTNERLLVRHEVTARVGLSTSALYAKMSAGTFPHPIKIGTKSVRWRGADIKAWIARPLDWTAALPMAA